MVDEGPEHVTFSFRTPYVIGATPSDSSTWGIYKNGGRNGLVLRGSAKGKVSVSVDDGRTWQDAGEFRDGLDLTDFVKGRQNYLLRLHAAASALANSDPPNPAQARARPIAPVSQFSNADLRLS